MNIGRSLNMHYLSNSILLMQCPSNLASRPVYQSSPSPYLPLSSEPYTNSLVTFENSPFSSFVFQKIGFVSLNPCFTQPSSFT